MVNSSRNESPIYTLTISDTDKRKLKFLLETTGGSRVAQEEMFCRSSVFIVYILCHPRSGQRLLFKMATTLSQQWHICPAKWNSSIFFLHILAIYFTHDEFYRTITIQLIASWPESQRNNCNLLLNLTCILYIYIVYARWNNYRNGLVTFLTKLAWEPHLISEKKINTI